MISLMSAVPEVEGGVLEAVLGGCRLEHDCACWTVMLCPSVRQLRHSMQRSQV